MEFTLYNFVLYIYGFSKKLVLVVFLWGMGFSFVVAQPSAVIRFKTDSLSKKMSETTEDSIKVKLLLQIEELNYLENSELAKKSCENAIEIANRNLKNKSLSARQKLFYSKSLSTAFTNLGLYYSGIANYQMAFDYLQQSITISKKIKNQLGELNAINNLANIYYQQGMYAKAADHYNKCLHIAERIHDFDAMVTSYINIGSIHVAQNNADASIPYFEKALNILKKHPNMRWETNAIINLGYSYQAKRMYNKAEFYFEQGTKLAEENGFQDAYLGGLNGLGINCNNWADSAYKSGDVKRAESLLKKSIGLLDKCLLKAREMNYSEYIPSALINKGLAYYYWKKYAQSAEIAQQALAISKRQNNMLPLMQAYNLLYQCFKKMNRTKEALEMHEYYQLYSDSVDSEDSKNKVMQKEFEYAYTKRAIADSITHAKEKEKSKLEIASQQLELNYRKRTQYFLYAGLILVALFGFLMYNRFKHTQKQKLIIEQQKRVSEEQRLIIEEKHREITDSINYAERLQRSLMASRVLLDHKLKDYFIYFNPKEKVSGDFYWSHELKNGNFLFACADSTGHGVPGAIMSMLNMNSLKESVQMGLTEPGDILNKTRDIIIATLKNDGSEDGGKDGMDAALLSFNFKTNSLSFALSNNPLWLIRNGQLKEFLPDKMPVGRHDKQQTSFSQFTYSLEKGDLLVMLTDGFADQFGGEKGKKFKYKNLQQLLLNHANEKTESIQLALQEAFTNWRGELEQVDDVCVVGVRY